MYAVDAVRVDLDAGLECTAGALEVGGRPPLLDAGLDQVRQVVDQAQVPRVLLADLVLAGQLDAVLVQLDHLRKQGHEGIVPIPTHTPRAPPQRGGGGGDAFMQSTLSWHVPSVVSLLLQ